MSVTLVLCGPLACGKSSLARYIAERRSDIVLYDVFDYINRYRDDTGHIKPDDTITAYGEFYSAVAKAAAGNIIIEIGTNHPEFNMEHLARLQTRGRLEVLFCLLDWSICAQRVRQRNHEGKKISERDLQERMKRVFPDNHELTADRLGISHRRFSMDAPLELLYEKISQQNIL